MPDEKVLKPAEKKPAAKKATKASAAGKPAAKRAPRKKAVPAPTPTPLETATTLIWNKLEKKKVADLPEIAIQVNVADAGVFFVAINTSNDNGEFEAVRVVAADYKLASGYAETTLDEIKKIAAGNYDFIEAIRTDALKYYGELKKGVALADLLK